MKNQYIESLRDGDYVNDAFVAIRKDLRTKQDGGKFLGMVFKDRTGEVGGVLWNNAAEIAEQFELGDIVNVRGLVNTYQNRLQIRVEQVVPLRDGDYDLADLVEKPVDTSDVLDKFAAVLKSIQSPHLLQLAEAFLDDTTFMESFTSAAAAKRWHHEYPGGLLQHCYEMSCIAETMCTLFSNVDRDLLVMGVFLHDIGKIREMQHGLFVEYTTEGRLLGHIHIGCAMIEEKIRGIDGFPDKTKIELLHLMLSHHGERALGSPVVPETLEAVVLHHIDNLDAQAAAFTRLVEDARKNGQEWTDYQPLIERAVWTRRFKDAE